MPSRSATYRSGEPSRRLPLTDPGGRETALGPIEAPYIFRHGDYHYLYVSFDHCCRGAQSTHRVMVGRSTSVTGPYHDRNGVAMTSRGGTGILASHGSIHGPGGQGVLADTHTTSSTTTATPTTAPRCWASTGSATTPRAGPASSDPRCRRPRTAPPRVATAGRPHETAGGGRLGPRRSGRTGCRRGRHGQGARQGHGNGSQDARRACVVPLRP
ncbi:family 43 glycosylhydrolase [Streptomyces sp. MK5]|uniref:family 43 glycosylhydrolase n=1 Tax=Streptomyces sp. MK5 TaxID=3064253 RepID=UPI0035570F20